MEQESFEFKVEPQQPAVPMGEWRNPPCGWCGQPVPPGRPGEPAMYVSESRSWMHWGCWKIAKRGKEG